MSSPSTSTVSATAVAPLIPDAQAVRVALAQNVVEARLLRQQLRICERRARDAELLATLKRQYGGGTEAARAG